MSLQRLCCLCQALFEPTFYLEVIMKPKLPGLWEEGLLTQASHTTTVLVQYACMGWVGCLPTQADMPAWCVLVRMT